MREHRYHVYIVASRSRTLYIGMTSSIATRIQQHKAGTHESFSKHYNCNRLVSLETHDLVANAINREKTAETLVPNKKASPHQPAKPSLDRPQRKLGHPYRYRPKYRSYLHLAYVKPFARARRHPEGPVSDDDEVTPQLQTELWTSWASLLRAYAGAHGLNATHHAVTEVGAHKILLRVDTRLLRFTHTEATLPNAPAIPFSLNEDGTATLNGHTEEMDLLAERLAREMMHPTLT